jgi:hypothetical protein
LDKEVLIPQVYGEDWANRFWDDISPVLADPRYIKWDDAPILVIYRLGKVPDAARAIDTWRKRAADDGHPRLHVIGVAAPREERPWPKNLRESLDDLVTFPPGSGVSLHPIAGPSGAELIAGRPDAVLSYDAIFEGVDLSGGTIPCISPGWDNTARRGEEAFILYGANPVTWRRHLGASIQMSAKSTFVNAWNEWAEGASVEMVASSVPEIFRVNRLQHPWPHEAIGNPVGTVQ